MKHEIKTLNELAALLGRPITYEWYNFDDNWVENKCEKVELWHLIEFERKTIRNVYIEDYDKRQQLTLIEFVKEFICHNSLIRLVYLDEKGDFCTVESTWDIVSMEHALINNKGPFVKYANNLVIGIKDIFISKNDKYSEAINIVIEK